MASLRFDSWHDVVAFACTLPDIEMAPFYGTPCPKLNGKALAAPGREAGSFAVMARPDEKEILLETDPATFWQAPHYEGWHALLVRRRDFSTHENGRFQARCDSPFKVSYEPQNRRSLPSDELQMVSYSEL